MTLGDDDPDNDDTLLNKGIRCSNFKKLHKLVAFYQIAKVIGMLTQKTAF